MANVEKDLCCNAIFGDVFIRRYGTNEPLREIGNITALSITNENAEIETPSGRTIGGTECKLTYTDTATLNMTLTCLKGRNLALALAGDGEFENVAAATVTDESHIVAGDFEGIEFARVPDQTAVITVTNDDGSVTYTLGEDYTLIPMGIQLCNGGNIAIGDELLISYSHGNNTLIDALIRASREFEIVVSATDFGNNETPVKIKLFRVDVPPTSEISIIEAGRTEFATVTLEAEVLRDDSRPTGSKYYTYEYGALA